MRRYGYMRYLRREKRVHRKERSFHRWLAMFMAAVLMLSESNLSVLAEENTSNVVSMEEADANNVEDTDDAGGTSDTEDEGEIPDDDGDDTSNINGTDGTGDTDNPGGTEDEGEMPDEDNEDENNCICGSKCSEDMVNGECPICAENYENCGVPGSEETEEAIAEDGVAVALSDNEGIEAYADSAEFEDSGVQYRVVGSGQVEVIGHIDGTSVSGTVVIPKTVECDGSTYKVTSIGDEAFALCYRLTNIEIPNSVTSIGHKAFYGCNGLTSIKIPNSVKSLSGFAFNNCNGLTSIKIPNSVTSIGTQAFGNCRGLISIEIPNSITRIEYALFLNCPSLISIEIPDSVTSIGDGAFRSCSGLTSIVIPDSVKSIEGDVFHGCSSLKNIEIPNGVTSIGYETFRDCSSLTSIKIPNGITSIGYDAFRECGELRTLQIMIPSDGTAIRVPDVRLKDGRDAFNGTPDDRYITFIKEDGSPLTGSALKAAQNAFKAANDGDATDNLWWGWKLGESDDSEITINVRKDNSDWADHTRKFALQSAADSGAALITDLTSVADGQYKIYDITGGEDAASRIDTEETITVSSGEGEATVNYYTVTFCDDDIAYAADTPQAPQIILKGKKASKPTDAPTKTGHQFKGWVTTKGGSIPFDFENSVINSKTNIYADWTADTYNITYHLDGYTASQKDSTYTYGGRTLPAPTQSGYDFDGWYTNAEYSGKKVTSIGSTETGDKEFYGRWIKKPDAAYLVSVKVRRDGEEWENHDREFMLLTEAGSRTATFEVAPGTYYIYDVTGVPIGSFATDGVNTDISVSVVDQDVEVTVDYYTVTFYDGSTAYEDSTPQAMQTVLGGKTAKEPKPAPSKEGYTFNRWMTEDNGSESFDFSVKIGSKSEAYASWISNAATEYNIAAMAGEGGSISPEGNVRVQEGGTQTFAITPDDGYRIKAVTVDGMNRTDELTDSAIARAIRAQSEMSRYYTFVDVKDDHTIRATFEKESGNTGTGDNTGDGGNTGTGDNTGDSGNTGTGDNTGDSGNTGTGDNTGDSGNAGTGDNTGDSSSGGTGGNNGSESADDNAVINISNVENAGGSPAENSNLGTISTNNTTGNPSKDTEPKTGDTSHVEIYATVAMIAGLTYLLLYFADKEKGMTEEKKQELVSSMISWARRGRRIRKYVVLVPIFILLCYYHSIGKRIEVEWDEEPVWAEL